MEELNDLPSKWKVRHQGISDIINIFLHNSCKGYVGYSKKWKSTNKKDVYFCYPQIKSDVHSSSITRDIEGYETISQPEFIKLVSVKYELYRID